MLLNLFYYLSQKPCCEKGSGMGYLHPSAAGRSRSRDGQSFVAIFLVYGDGTVNSMRLCWMKITINRKNASFFVRNTQQTNTICASSTGTGCVFLNHSHKNLCFFSSLHSNPFISSHLQQNSKRKDRKGIQDNAQLLSGLLGNGALQNI